MNLFVVQGVRGRDRINQVMVGVLPFLAPLLATVGILRAVHDIALWLPEIIN